MTLAIRRIETKTGIGYALVSGNTIVSEGMPWTAALEEWERRKREEKCHRP